MQELNKQEFGAFVAALRRERGMTQKDLAQKLHISDKAVSKWETGVSIPDTPMLLPLAEILGVSVTELLTCRRQPAQEPLPPEEVEQIVKTAIAYPGSPVPRGAADKGRWLGIYLACALTGLGIQILALWLEIPVVFPWLPQIMGLVFGGYFCFFYTARLPDYYDQNKISGVMDGFFRMNVPGLYFNNRNWPHMVRYGRIWAMATMALLPVLDLLASVFFPSLWRTLGLFLFLALLLGGLFVPMYVLGKKYE